MCTYFSIKTDKAQNLIDEFFSNFEKIWGAGLLSEKTKLLYAELNERAEAATSSYLVTG